MSYHTRDRFIMQIEKRQALKAAEAAGHVADSQEVRLQLIARMKAGELTVEQAKAELSKIQRGARAAGKVTREQAYRNGVHTEPRDE